MAMHNPVGRANYEPNSWGTQVGGPRETKAGFTTYPEENEGTKRRLRAASFADHYSQAHLFFSSQTKVEQKHIADALTFELSKCEVPAIRERVVSHLVNIDGNLAKTVADNLGINPVPAAFPAASKPRHDLPQSPQLSIQKMQLPIVKGRKLGILVTDGTDAKLLDTLTKSFKDKGADVELIAPKIGGVTLSDGKHVPAQQKVDGGPSVLYDFVAIIPGKDGVVDLVKNPTARDFVCDAYAHYKFVGHNKAAAALFAKAGLSDSLDAGFFALEDQKGADAFLKACEQKRFWDRKDAA